MGFEMTGKLAFVLILASVSAYLLGSINFAIIVTKCFRRGDIRDYGSGNAGMTNVLRTLGKVPAVLTLLGDVLKGIVAVVVGWLLFRYVGGLDAAGASIACYISGFFALLGHAYPVYYGFRGGKGILVTSGILLVLDPVVFAIALGFFILLVATTRMVSAGSLAAAVSLPFSTYILHTAWGRPHPALTTALISAFSLLVIVMHRQNIRRLLTGTEHRFGDKKPGGDDHNG